MSDIKDQSSLLDSGNAGIELAIPVAHRMGIRIVELGEGHAVGTAPLEGNTNHLGTLYAGSGLYPTLKDVQIRFCRPATSAVRATASLDSDAIARIKAEVEANGKSEFVLDAQVTDEAGEIVATTRGVYQLRTHGS